MSEQPLVSVALITYKQEGYIDECIQSALAQKVDFPMEIVVGDDCSPDSTGAILEGYAQKYPDIVKYKRREKNLGMHRNWEQTIRDCNGKYIALLEGDDYWIDEQKLAKQVKLMEANPDAAMIFTNAEVLNQTSMVADDTYVMPSFDSRSEFSFEELLKSNPAPTCTVLFRNGLFDKFPEEYYKSPYADWMLNLLNAQHGRILYLKDVTSVYRYHPGGVFGQSNEILRIQRMYTCYELIGSIFSEDKKASLLVEGFKKETNLRLEKEYRKQGLFSKYLVKYLKNRLQKKSA